MYLLRDEPDNFQADLNRDITVVGCGGTGAFVAEGLCRLAMNDETIGRIMLVDHDRVEERNVGRQNFYPEDVGGFKSQVLAERLARQFQRPIRYSIYPFITDKFDQWASSRIIIGCVDNAQARSEIAATFDYNESDAPSHWWLDAGNGLFSGQVLIGNRSKAGTKETMFVDGPDVCTGLPIPSVQLPSLMTPAPKSAPALPCAQAVEAGDQSPTINQAMASLVLEYVRRFYQGTLPWMGTYIDQSTGTLSTVMAEPDVVARTMNMTKKGASAILSKSDLPKVCEDCGQVHEEERIG